MAERETTQWNLKFTSLMACNCNYGCPCAFNAPPTFHTCEAVLGYDIQEGNYGATPLDGLRWVLIAVWPGPLHERNGRGLVLLDNRADEDQREALESIATGKAGGPIGILMSTVTAGIDVKTAPLEVDINGKDSRLHVPGGVEVEYGPILNPVTGAEHEAAALLPNGMLTKREDFYSADTMSVNMNGFEFSYPGRNGYTMQHLWNGP